MRAFVTALAIGLVLLGVAAWRDRRARLAREHALHAPSPALTPDQLATVDAWRQGPAERLDAVLADPRLTTHPPLAILSNAVVVVVADASMDDLAPVVSRAARHGSNLLVVAGHLDAAAIDTLAVNLRLGVVTATAVIAGPEARSRAAVLAGCSEADPADLRADTPILGLTGRIPRVVADDTGCWIGPED